MSDLDDYSEPRHGGETDIMYRVRNDGEFVLLLDADGEETLAGLRVEDIETIRNDPDVDITPG